MKSLTGIVAFLAVMTAGPGFPQTLNPSPREILNLEQSLLPAEIAIVLSAARQALSGKAWRLSPMANGVGP